MKKAKYIKDVLKNINANRTIKERIKEDLSLRIDELEEMDPFFNVIEELGKPSEVAREFMENLDLNKELRVQIRVGTSAVPYEFKSKRSLFGLPLVHINTGGRYNNNVAKGIIAVGDISIGVISIGGVSFGLISIGGIGLGVIGIGGVAIGALGLGGVAIGLQAYGGVALGIIESFGAFARTLTVFR